MNSIIVKAVLALCVFFFTPLLSAGEAENPPHPRVPHLSAKQKAELVLAKKQYKEAVLAYKSLLKEDGEDSALFRGLVKAYLGENNSKSAENFIKSYLSSHPESSAAQYGFGYFYYLQGDDPNAQARFEEAVRLNAGNALAWNNWGASLSRTKSYTYAVEKVKEAIRLDPDNAMYYNNLRRIYREMGAAGLFIADYNRYVKEGPRLVAQGYGRRIAKALRQEAFQHYSQGDPDSAIRKFRKIVVIFEETGLRTGLVPIFFGLAVLYEEKGDEQRAQKYFKDVLSINPNHLQAREKVK